jgi:hypothetical protein
LLGQSEPSSQKKKYGILTRHRLLLLWLLKRVLAPTTKREGDVIRDYLTISTSEYAATS